MANSEADDDLESLEGDVQIQARLVAKQPEYSVPDQTFSLPTASGPDQLNQLVKQLLPTVSNEVVFDFLINEAVLRESIEQFLELNDPRDNKEQVLQIEFIRRRPAPRPEGSLSHDDWVSSLDSAGSLLASGCYDSSLGLWNLDNVGRGKSQLCCPIVVFPVGTAAIKCLKFTQHDSDKSTIVCGSHDQNLYLIDVVGAVGPAASDRLTYRLRNVCKGHSASVDGVCVQPSGRNFLSASFDRMIKVWSCEEQDPSERYQIVDDDNEAESDNEKESAAAAKRRRLGNSVATKTPELTLSGHKEAVSKCQWPSDQLAVTCSWDHTIRLWDMQQAVEQQVLFGNKAFSSISCSSIDQPNEPLLILAAAMDSHIRLYDPRSQEGNLVKSSFSGHSGWVSDVSWSRTKSSKQFLSASFDQTMKLWDLRSPKTPVYEMSGHSEKILACHWTLTDRLVSAGADCRISIFRASDAILNVKL